MMRLTLPPQFSPQEDWRAYWETKNKAEFPQQRTQHAAAQQTVALEILLARSAR
jgi:hypothetical protein